MATTPNRDRITKAARRAVRAALAHTIPPESSSYLHRSSRGMSALLTVAVPSRRSTPTPNPNR